jgi:hypothetical protein
MTLADLDAWLPRLYYISQVLLLFVAVSAGIGALLQLRNSKLFELLKYFGRPAHQEGKGHRMV